MNDKSKSTNDNAVRGFVTVYITVQALALIVFFGCAPFINMKISSDESMGIVQLILPLFTGYIGLILGFYFGSQEPQ